MVHEVLHGGRQVAAAGLGVSARVMALMMAMVKVHALVEVGEETPEITFTWQGSISQMPQCSSNIYKTISVKIRRERQTPFWESCRRSDRSHSLCKGQALTGKKRRHSDLRGWIMVKPKLDLSEGGREVWK
jgi:hypothetical protein